MAASYVEIPDPRLAVAPKVKKFKQIWEEGRSWRGIPKLNKF